jgi:penicillin-binding protein 1C
VKRLFLIILLFMSAEHAYALPAYQDVRRSYVKSDSLLLDRHGKAIHESRTDSHFRRLDWTPLPEISPALTEALLQAEDRRFYSHSGVDYGSVGAALLSGVSQESLRGASTITMQLVSLLNREIQPQKKRRSLLQKGRQILKAWEIEKSWSKQEILETYLNLVTFRGEIQGIAAASRGLFGKDPHGLDRMDSIILASLIRSPNAPCQEVSRRSVQLNRSLGWSVPDDDLQRKVNQIFLNPPAIYPGKALTPHVARLILKDEPKGSTVASTLDRRLQQFASDRLAHHLKDLKQQNARDGAVLIVENSTGDVLAYESYAGEPLSHRYVDGIQAKRQAGSTLKPLLYATAFDRLILTPASILDDTPLDIAVVNGIYQPRNYDSEFRGLVTARTALASSLNVPAVQVLSLVDTESFLDTLRQTGIKGLNEAGNFYGPALALGSADVSLWEMTNAYRTLANGGEWSGLRLTPEPRSPPKREKVFSRETAFLVSDILSDREARSSTFGLENPLSTKFWSAVKTGTSKDMRDNWCIGYSEKYTVGVWVGNFSGDAMWNVSGITGAAPVWLEMMNFLHRNEKASRAKYPPGLVRKELNYSPVIDSPAEEWFIRGTEPRTIRKIEQLNQRIAYPPQGTVIALDPDIPPELQKVFFVSQSNEEGLRWRLNDDLLEGTRKTLSWSPKTGKYILSLSDREGTVVDAVHFEVRGPLVSP